MSDPNKNSHLQMSIKSTEWFSSAKAEIECVEITLCLYYTKQLLFSTSVNSDPQP